MTLGINFDEMNDEERKTVTEIVEKLFAKLSAHSLKRCTFFADAGYPILEKIAKVYAPQIFGDDKNPFNQHYWLSISLPNENTENTKKRTIIIDPIFEYIGLEDEAEKVLDNVYLNYYRRKRIVSPNKSHLEGGIRINTMGI